MLLLDLFDEFVDPEFEDDDSVFFDVQMGGFLSCNVLIPYSGSDLVDVLKNDWSDMQDCKGREKKRKKNY